MLAVAPDTYPPPRSRPRCPSYLRPSGGLRRVSEQVHHGPASPTVLAALPSGSDDALGALADSLAAAERYGLPLAPVLERLSGQARCRAPPAAGGRSAPIAGATQRTPRAVHPAVVRPAGHRAAVSCSPPCRRSIGERPLHITTDRSRHEVDRHSTSTTLHSSSPTKTGRPPPSTRSSCSAPRGLRLLVVGWATGGGRRQGRQAVRSCARPGDRRAVNHGIAARRPSRSRSRCRWCACSSWLSCRSRSWCATGWPSNTQLAPGHVQPRCRPIRPPQPRGLPTPPYGSGRSPSTSSAVTAVSPSR